jgi:hypothetical protein
MNISGQIFAEHRLHHLVRRAGAPRVHCFANFHYEDVTYHRVACLLVTVAFNFVCIKFEQLHEKVSSLQEC